MAGKTAILSVRVISDTKNAQRGATETATAWEKFEKRLDKASIVAGVAGVALFKLGKDAYDMGSKLQQSTGAVEAVFKDQAGSITKFAETAWDSVGLSQNKAQEMATLMGSQLKNLGVPMEGLAGQTTDLIGLGADLAATYGGTAVDAVEALSSLLKGERNPIERYGVTITQAMVNAEKAALGLDGLTGAADRNADMQATLALLTKQTADAHGMWSAEADTAEGKAQRLAERWETVQGQLGEKLLPVITDVTASLVTLVGWVAENSDLVMQLGGVIGGTVVAVLGLNAAIKTARVISTVFSGITSAGSATVGVIGRFVGGMRNASVAQSTFSGAAGTLGGKVTQLVTAMGKGAVAAAKWAVQTTVLTAKFVAQKVAQLAIAVASRVAAVAQGLWNAVMNANPIMLIITLIVAAIVLLVMNWEKVQAVALVVWEAITTAATWFWENVLKPIGDFVGSVFVAYWTALKTVATGVWNAIKSVGVGFWNWLKSIGQWIKATFVVSWTVLKVGATAVWNSIKSAGASLWNSIKSIASWIGGTFRNAWNGLKNAGMNALNAIISPVQNLISWLRQAWDWVGKVFDSAGKIAGSLFKFSHTTDPGAPVTAALGSSPSFTAAFPAARAADTNITIRIEMPNYVGDRRDLERWMTDALRKVKIRNERLVTI